MNMEIVIVLVVSSSVRLQGNVMLLPLLLCIIIMLLFPIGFVSIGCYPLQIVAIKMLKIYLVWHYWTVQRREVKLGLDTKN